MAIQLISLVSHFAANTSSFTFNGVSLATGVAQTIASAAVDVVANAQVCENCTASAAAAIQLFEEIILTAIAENEFNLEGAGSPGVTVEQAVSVFIESVVNNTVIAAASVRPLPPVPIFTGV